MQAQGAHKRLFLCLYFRIISMNDFFIANNESLPHVFIDQKIEVKQIQVKNLDHFTKHANELKKKLESYSIEAITPLIEPHILQVMGICSLTTTLDVDHFMKHSGDIAAVSELVLKIIEVNEAFFKKEKEQHGQDKNVTWFDSFQYLIGCGHRHDDIMNMSYNSFLKYIEAAQKNEQKQLKSYAVAMRVANHAKQQDFERYLKNN